MGNRILLVILVASACADPRRQQEAIVPPSDPEDPCDFEQDPACGVRECDESLGCADEDLGCALPISFAHDLQLGSRRLARGSCTGSSPELSDHSWEWTAPVSGTFRFHHSTGWLTIFGGACDGPELACNENHDGVFGFVELTLSEGQTVIVVASAVIERHFDLLIERVPVETNHCANGLDDDGDGLADCADPDCTPAADQDLGSALPVTVTGTTSGAGDDFWGASCAAAWSTGGLERDDVAFRWTAPAAGRYLVHTTGSGQPTLVRVLDADCPGTELACDLPFDPNEDRSPWGDARVELEAGQSIVVVVDGVDAAGPFVLTIAEDVAAETACADGRDDDGDGHPDCADADCASDAACAGVACAETDLGSAFPLDVTSTIADDDGGSDACGGHFTSDRAFAWTAPTDGTWLITVTASARPAFHVRAGCDGPELGCGFFSCDEGCPAEGEPWIVTDRVAVAAGQTVVIYVEGAEGSSFRLQIARVSRETHCRDGLDNDADGARDCADPDCREDGPCHEELSCTDGLDQDVDGLVDCADPDCLAVVDHDLGSSFPVTAAGDTTGLASDYPLSGCIEGGANLGADEAWRWVAPSAGTYTFAVDTDRTVVSLRSPACGTAELDCREFGPVTRTLAAGQEVLIVVMPFQSFAPVGPYTLTIR